MGERLLDRKRSRMKNQNETILRYSTTTCFGRCSSYDMTISATEGNEGTLEWQGRENTYVAGVRTKVFPRAELDALLHQIEDADFFSIQYDYDGWLDAQYFRIEVSANGRLNSARAAFVDKRAPEGLIAISKLLWEIADADGWVTGRLE
jgi:uncharacterized protein DUF6438